MMTIIHKIGGLLLVIVGLIVLPMPIPLGLIMITIGLALLAPYMPMVQRLIVTLRTKWPTIDASLIRNRHRFPQIVKTTIDKTTIPKIESDTMDNQKPTHDQSTTSEKSS